MLARGLWRGKRATLWLSIALFAISALLHLVKELDWEEAGVAMLLAGLPVCERRRFVRRSDPPSLKRLPGLISAAALFVLVYGAAGFSRLPSLRGAPFADA